MIKDWTPDLALTGALHYPGEGWHLTKFNTGRLRPEVQPRTLLYTICQKRYPFYIPFNGKSYPFHIPILEHCTPFLNPCNAVLTNFHVVLTK